MSVTPTNLSRGLLPGTSGSILYTAPNTSSATLTEITLVGSALGSVPINLGISVSGINYPLYLSVVVSGSATNYYSVKQTLTSGQSITGNGGTYVASVLSGSANGALIYSPVGIAFDNQQNMWISNFNNNNILKVLSGTTTAVSVLSGSANGATIYSPEFIAFDNQQNLWIGNLGNNNILEVLSGTTTVVSVLSGSANGVTLNGPQNIAFDNQQNMWIANTNGNNILKVASGTTTAVSGTPTLFEPIGIAFDSQQNLWISNYGNNSILKISSGTTTVVSVLSGSATGAPIYEPRGLTFDTQQNLWIANYGNNNILKVLSGTTTAISVLSGVTGGQIFGSTVSGPRSIAFDNQQNMWFSNYSLNNILEVYNVAPSVINYHLNGVVIS